MDGQDITKPTTPAYSPDGIHLLRTTAQIQYQLSQMADQKANMLLGVTFVIFTITVAQVRSGDREIPLLILGAAAFISAVLAILAVLPSVTTPPKSDSVRNILFFGSFAQLAEQEYVQAMLSIVGDHRTVYEAFCHDIYQNGRVLSRKKYLLLGYAYRVLLAGLVGSLVAFLIAYGLRTFGG
jgi:hypothetical protein